MIYLNLHTKAIAMNVHLVTLVECNKKKTLGNNNHWFNKIKRYEWSLKEIKALWGGTFHN